MFLSHLWHNLRNGEFTFGTDEERALRKAIQTCFTIYATQFICSKHLKDVGHSIKDREGIITLTFDNGMIHLHMIIK